MKESENEMFSKFIKMQKKLNTEVKNECQQ